MRQDARENENIELHCLLEAIFLKYGYDFRGYSNAHIKRRACQALCASGLDTFSALQHGILQDQELFDSLLLRLSINVTEMFRDPPFYLAVRQRVMPLLQSLPFVKIWHAGCASGEEVYSMAIVLKEAGVLERAQIYATDFNEIVVKTAREAIYPVERVREYTANYQRSGGTASFARYYSARYDSVILDQSLKERIVFADHNLVTDGSFGEMDMIVCRNVLIYFERELQNRVIGLFEHSLKRSGFLCIGSKESLRFSKWNDRFEEFDANQRIYRKKSPFPDGAQSDPEHS
jgi:chemotaxis protein methyltransferase CheR